MPGTLPHDMEFDVTEEEDVLICLVEKYAHIVESKVTNGVTFRQKQETWERIQREFIAQCNAQRSVKNLRYKYDNLKKKAKETLANDKKSIYKTGGGNFESKVNASTLRIAAILGSSATGLENKIDSDNFLEENVMESFEVVDDENVIIEAVETLLDTEDVPSLDFEETKPIESDCNWAKWNPQQLKKVKSPKLQVKNRSLKSEEVLDIQKKFFENEDKRAEERNKLQKRKLELKIELLQLEIEHKRILIEKQNDK
ncbi:uncharacterized protein LOC142230844 [Haematobia irritans]|uniref:uncharacterized protein LOC142230844 n=1 Tax=Haematobia irritans TaxID=7368 RepID=UPI003F4FD9CF